MGVGRKHWWNVGLKYTWEVGLVGDGHLQLVGDAPPLKKKSAIEDDIPASHSFPLYFAAFTMSCVSDFLPAGVSNVCFPVVLSYSCS